MSDKTRIEWTDATWNPVTGCTKVSEGCDHCYAETIAHRFAGTPAYPNGFAVTLRPERLDQPLRWQRPRRIFVNSMSDLFHADVPDEFIARVFAVMALAQQHTFQVLTKRPGRMRSLLSSDDFVRKSATFARDMWNGNASLREAAGGWAWDTTGLRPKVWPLPNVWLGTSVESQKWADVRIPQLLQTPAAVRFLSCEPLLGSLDLTGSGTSQKYWLTGRPEWGPEEVIGNGYVVQPLTVAPALDWVIVGGESGTHARPMHLDWARSLRDQCVAAGVAFHFKQWGEWAPFGPDEMVGAKDEFWMDAAGKGTYQSRRYDAGVAHMIRVGKKAAGRELDGRTWDEYPEVK